MSNPRAASAQTLRLLRALLDDPAGWHYGYDLGRRTGLASGTLYPILIRLADRGLLESRWEPAARPGRPPRHAYRLAPDGLRAARTELLRASASARRQARMRPARLPATP